MVTLPHVLPHCPVVAVYAMNIVAGFAGMSISIVTKRTVARTALGSDARGGVMVWVAKR